MADYSLIESSSGSSILRREGDRNVVIGSGMNPDEARTLLDRLNRRPSLRVGDCFEWIAAGAFVAAAYLQFISIPLALAVFGICLVYFAQCLATAELPRPRLPKVRLPKVKVGRLTVPIASIYRATSSTLRKRLARGDREHAPARPGD